MENFINETESSLSSLNAILKCCKNPISEEQAWALCYQCCCGMRRMASGSRQRLHTLVLQGPESILIHQDGTVSFATGRHTDASKTLKSERQIIYCLGWMIYKALDWGLTHNVERALSQPLDELLHAMLGLDYENNQSERDLKQFCTFKGITKICEERLVNPSEAANHYRAVCREQFAEHSALRKLVLTIQGTKMRLKKMKEADPEIKSPGMLNNWSCLWSNVVKELRLGIQLRNVAERLYHTLPVDYALTPFEHLMDDIRYKRYTLQKVTVCNSNKKTLHESFLDFIRSHPLKPASERKLKERSHEEPSLHELLMTEIKSAKRFQSKSSRVNGDTPDFFGTPKMWHSNRSEDSVLAGGLHLGGLLSKRPRLKGKEGTVPESEEDQCWRLEYSSEGSTESSCSEFTSSSTELDTDLVFVPVLTSSQITLKTSSFMNSNKHKSFFHRRSRSFESSFQSKDCSPRQADCTPPPPPPTIAQLIVSRQASVNSEIKEFLDMLGCHSSNRTHVCFSCHKKKLFFTWPYVCHVCDSVVCPDCCTEMLLPFQRCIHLPVSFLKMLMMTKEEDPASQMRLIRQFCQDVHQWDCSRVPVVFEPPEIQEEVAFHKKSMMNWFSMDLCTKCKWYLLDVINSNQGCRSYDGGRPRTISESF